MENPNEHPLLLPDEQATNRQDTGRVDSWNATTRPTTLEDSRRDVGVGGRDAIRAASEDQVKRSLPPPYGPGQSPLRECCRGAIPDKLTDVSDVGFRCSARIPGGSTAS